MFAYRRHNFPCYILVASRSFLANLQVKQLLSIFLFIKYWTVKDLIVVKGKQNHLITYEIEDTNGLYFPW